MQVENTLRPAFEAWAAAAWAVAALWCIGLAGFSGAPASALLATAGVAAVMAGVRGWQTHRNFRMKVSLAGRGFWQLPLSEVDKEIDKDESRIWLGRGFEWTAEHTARAETLLRTNPRDLLPPRWALRLMRVPIDRITGARGVAWIHGLEPDEQSVGLPWEHARGNNQIWGTTGSGKTRLYELMTYQMVRRGDVLIFIDPKGDKEIEESLRHGCERAGRPDAFLKFHPAFPQSSIRFDVTKNWNRATELPTRISDLLGAESNDPFVAFGWRSMNNIIGGMIYANERPSLVRLRAYLENGAESLLERCLAKWMTANLPGWEKMVDGVMASFSRERTGRRSIETRIQVNNPRLIALVDVYQREVPVDRRSQAINGLLSQCEHSRDHYSKMIQSLLPLLTQLTAEPLDELMSPNYDDLTDMRPIFDSDKVIRGSYVLYMATDSLPDATVGSAIAGITLSDIRAVAGARYNTGDIGRQSIHIVVDEAYEVINQPLVSIMNKARGANFITYLAAQTFADYVVKFGSEPQARMVLGNANNTICLRVIDLITARYVVEGLGKVNVPQISQSKTMGTKTEDGGMEYSANFSSSRGYRETDLFPMALLTRLPDLHYIATLSGGKIIKGRLPRVMQPGEVS